MEGTSGIVSIQRVHLRWSKGHRGAEAGAIRNRIDRSAPFTPPCESGSGWYQRIVRDASDGYAMKEKWYDLAETDPRLLPFSYRSENGILKIWNIPQGGKIRRPQLAGEMVRLPFGQKVSIHMNNASDGDHQRHYTEDAIHVAWSGASDLDVPLFREIDLRELLY